MISCQHDVDIPEDMTRVDDPTVVIDTCHPDSVYFDQDILPILNSNCSFSGCHDQGTAQDDIVLTSYEYLMNSGIVKVDDPEDSDLIEAITSGDTSEVMPPPPYTPLTSEQIALIRKWIDQGAQDLTCIGRCDTNVFSFAAVIFPLIENRCTGCHRGNAPGGGIHLTNYPEIKAIADDGRLSGVVKHLKGYKAMPLGGQKLAVCQITQIEKWIAHGAKDD